MADRHQNFVSGKWGDAVGKGTFEKLNPANKSESLGTFPRSDHRDVDRAVDGVRSQGRQWSALPALARGEILSRTVALCRARRDAVAEAVTRESGKLLPDAIDEVQAGLEALAVLAGERGGRVEGGAAAAGSGCHALAFPVPCGVAAVLTSWSLPFAVMLTAAGGALIAGNSVVLKPSEHTPLVGQRILEFLLEAGVPAGVVALVQGGGEEVGAPLMRHPDVAVVALTGAADVVREAAIACAAEQKRPALEILRREVTLVLEDAELETAVRGILQGSFAPLAGRAAPVGAVVVQGKVGKELLARLVEAAGRASPGDGLEPASTIPPLVTERHLKRLQAWVRTGVREGAKLLSGGEIYREADCRRGWFYAPTVLAEVQSTMRVSQDEVWGPALAVLSASTVEDAVARVNALPGSSAVGIYSRNLGHALRLAEELHAEHVRINESSRHLPRVPLGVEGPGLWSPALRTFARWRTITLDVGTSP